MEQGNLMTDDNSLKIGYARVSTDDQNLDLQRNALTKAGCTKIFEDTMSGAKADRPGLSEALEYLEKGDTLVVWRLDRLGRSVRDLIDLTGRLDKAGIHFESIAEKIDTSRDTGKMVFHTFALLAEFERNLTRERTQGGLESARARGRKGGRPPLPSETTKAIQDMMANPDNSPEKVMKALGISKTSLYRYAKKGSQNGG